MLAASGGGGAGGTPWGLMTVEQMQQNIQNPDTDQHYKLLTGWKHSADLINEHRWQVTNYRDNLAAVWPPDRNAASEAYISRLNELIANLEDTYEAAIANHDAFARATLSISLAQKDMDEIAREYLANEQALTAFTAKQENASGQPTPSPSPSGEQPPVAPGRQQELYQKAVTLLSGVSGDLAQAQVSVRTPTLYKPTLPVRRDEPSGGDGGGYQAPPIPPITPTFGSETPAATSPGRPSATFPTTPNVAPPTAPLPPAQQPGLVLGGATPLAPAPPALGLPTVTPPISVTPGPTPGLGLLPPTPSGFGPAGGNTLVPPANSPLGRNAGLPREGGVIRAGGSTPGGMHVLPPGGVIGGTPGLGVAQPGGARAGVQRGINPVGGVIGGGTPTGKPGGTNVPGQHGSAAGPYGQAGGRGVGRHDHEEHAHWDPDNPWQTASGVDPVVLPSREQRVDPGPAIGLN